jgi:transcriptional regulator GlxA family with amidase domain
MQEIAPETTRVVAMVGFDGIQMLDVTGPLEVLSLASRVLVAQHEIATPPYEVKLVARTAGPVTGSSGMALVAADPWSELGPVDTLLVPGGAGTRQALDDQALICWLSHQAPRARRFGSICTGALLLARAGLLDDRRVTTHWAYVQELAELAPTAKIEPDAIYVRDRELWTSAGVTTGMDMALAIVEEDWGRKLALEVAQQLVLYLKRPGGQSQFSPTLAAQAATAGGRFRGLAAWIFEHLDQPLSIEALAAHAEMSPRHFSRSFREELGTTPAKFVERARFEVARRLLAECDDSLERIAAQCGFGSAETLRRVFVRRTGMGPAAYRHRLQRDELRAPAPPPARGL